MRTRVAYLTAALLVLLGCVVFTPSGRGTQVQAQTPAAVPRDVIVLLDVTLSMRGFGTDPLRRDIWDQVRDRVLAQIDQLADGTSLMIVPFASGPQYRNIWPSGVDRPDTPGPFAAMDGGGRAEAKKFIAGREPDGQATFICDSLD